MHKIQTTAMAAALSLAVLLAPSGTNAQAPGSPSGVVKTKGLMFGLHLNGSSISTEDADDESTSSKKERASGGGLGATIGWGFTKWLMVYGGVDAAQVKIEGVTGVDDDDEQPDYTLIHGDLGVRFSFPSPNHGFVPYLNAALTTRVATAELNGEDIAISGNGATVGGGLQFFFNPKWALDVGLQVSSGKFTDVEVGALKLDLKELGADIENTTSARFNVGMKFYPHFGKK